MAQERLDILIIDDDEDDYVITRDLLTEIKGYITKITWVNTYEAALENLRHHVYDICLVDYNLGHLNGVDLVREVIEYGYEAPLILLTGQGEPDVDLEALKSGAADYLVKGQTTAIMLQRSIRYAIGRKQADKALQESEERFRKVIASISDHIYVGDLTDPNNPISRYISPNVEDLTGYPAEHFKDSWHFWHKLLHPDDITKALTLPEHLIHGGHRENEYRLYRIDGEMIWVRDSQKVEIEKNRHGEVKRVSVYGVVSDITQRKVVERALRTREERYRQSEESSPNPIFSINQAGIIQTWNRACRDIFGYDQEIIGASYQKLLANSREATLIKKMLTQIFNEGSLKSIDITFMCQDGTERFMVSRLYPLANHQGTVTECVFGNTDITERKWAEEALKEAEWRYRSLFNDAPVMYVITHNKNDRDLIADCNKLFLKTLGYTRAEVLRCPISDFYSIDSQMELVKINNDISDIDGDSITQERQLLTKTGDVIETILEAVPEKNKQGQVIGTRAMFIDITTRKRADAELQERAVQLTLIHDIWGQLAAVLEQHSVLQKAARLIQNSFDFYHVAMFMLEGEEVRLKALATPHNVTVKPGLIRKLDEGIIGWVAGHGQKIVANDVSQEPRYIPWSLEKSITKAELCLPIKIGDQTLGILDIQSPEINTFNRYDILALEILMDQIAVALENARLYAESQRRSKELATLNQASRVMTSTLDREIILQETMMQANTILEAESASIILYDEADNQLVFAAIAGPNSHQLFNVRMPPDVGIAGWIMHEKKPVLLNNAQQDSRLYRRIDELIGLTTHSILAVPLLFKDNAIGVVEVVNKIDGKFTKYDLEMLESLTNSAAIAIENARLYDETKMKTKQLSILHELDRAISTSLNINDVYHAFTHHAARLFTYDWTAITLWRGENLHITYLTGVDKETLPEDHSLLNQNSDINWVINNGQHLLRDDITTPITRPQNEYLVSIGIQSTLCIPLRIKGQIIGSWNMGSKQKSAYHKGGVEIAQSMADQLAICIENARLFEQVRIGREQLKVLAQQVVSAQEDERRRLSRELHDEAGQALTALKIGLNLIQDDLPPEAEMVQQRMAEAVELTGETMDRLRSIARDLRPPALDTAGLNPTMEGLCLEFGHRTNLPIEYFSNVIVPLPDTINICLYRLLQEALTNIAKHAHASEVVVELEQGSGYVRLIVEDDGRGFDLDDLEVAGKPKGIGLLGMEERVELLSGKFEIKTQKGSGTCLVAQIPV